MRRNTPTGLAALLLATVSGAQTGWAAQDAYCGFSVECRNRDACRSTDWSALASRDGPTLVLQPDGPQIRLSALQSGGDVLHFASADRAGASYLFSVAADGSAILTMRSFSGGLENFTWYGDCSGQWQKNQ